MKSYSIILLLFLQASLAVSQISENKIQQISDSVIIAQAGDEFHKNLIFDEMFTGKAEGILLDANFKEKYSLIPTSIPLSKDTMLYWVGYKIGKSKSLITRKEAHYSQEPYISMYFIQFHKLYLTIPDFEVFDKYLERSQTNNFISEAKAISTANEHFPNKVKDGKNQQLTYHTEDDKMYWLISREKGFMAVRKYIVLVDAIDGTYARIEESSFERGFFKSIGSLFSRSYKKSSKI